MCCLYIYSFYDFVIIPSFILKNILESEIILYYNIQMSNYIIIWGKKIYIGDILIGIVDREPLGLIDSVIKGQTYTVCELLKDGQGEVLKIKLRRNNRKNDFFTVFYPVDLAGYFKLKIKKIKKIIPPISKWDLLILD